MEEKVYHRQVFKKCLASKILSNPRNAKLFDRETLQQLFAFPARTIEFYRRSADEREQDSTASDQATPFKIQHNQGVDKLQKNDKSFQQFAS